MPMNPRLLRPVATSGFDPRTIANLGGWYNASNSSSVTIETGVKRWSDLSGNGRDLIQDTLNDQPGYVQSGINGRPVIDFDGSNDFLSASFTLPQPVRIFCVGNFRTATVGNQFFDGTSGNSMRLYVNSSTSLGIFAGAPVTATVASVLGWFVAEAVFNGTSSSLLRNGTVLATGNPGSTSPNGLRLAVFGTGAAAFTNCQIAEVIFYSRAITDSEANAVRSYLGKKYAITVV